LAPEPVSGPREVNAEAHLLEHRRLGPEGAVGLLGARSVGDLDVVRGMAGHHLVAADPVEDGMEDRPLWGGGFPPPLRLLAGEGHRAGAADVGMELASRDEDPAPDDLPCLRDALQRAAAEAEVHGRLPLARGAAVAVDEVLRRRGAR